MTSNSWSRILSLSGFSNMDDLRDFLRKECPVVMCDKENIKDYATIVCSDKNRLKQYTSIEWGDIVKIYTRSLLYDK